MVVLQLREGATMAAPHASMIIVQMIQAVYIVLNEVSLVQGISSPVFIFYEFMVATLFMGTLAFIFERKGRPPMSKKTLCWIFLMALLGITFMENMTVACLYFVSGSIESAVLNMIPIFTYTLSVISRQEKPQLNTWRGKGKLFGTLLSVSGAVTLSFWKDPSADSMVSTSSSTSLGYWVLGLVMVVGGVFALSSWILLLGPMTSLYPAEFTLTAMMFGFALLQQGVVVAIVSHKSSQWKLQWNLELLNIFVGGMLNSGVSNLFVTFCTAAKGPVFVSSFSTLGLIFTTILEIGFLGSSLHIGRVIGVVMILMGLYMYLLCKSKEETYQTIDDGYEPIKCSLPT